MVENKWKSSISKIHLYGTESFGIYIETFNIGTNKLDR